MEFLSSVWQRITDALVPPRKTERVVRGLTKEILSRLRDSSSVTGIEALLPYGDARVQSLIWELKYYGSSSAATLLGELLADELPELIHESLTARPLLIPVPLHPNREKTRGYNQTERVTAWAASSCADLVEHVPLILMRTSDTPRQTALPRSSRIRNVAGAFTVTDPSYIHGRTCILVDDVVTTGSTLSSAKKALRDAGADKVITIALAHAG